MGSGESLTLIEAGLGVGLLFTKVVSIFLKTSPSPSKLLMISFFPLFSSIRLLGDVLFKPLFYILEFGFP